MPSERTTRATDFVPNVILSGNEVGNYGPCPQSVLSFEFHNGTGEDITVVTRTGVQIQIPPLRGARFHNFVIVTKYAAGFNVFVDTGGSSYDQGHSSSLEAKKIESAVFKTEYGQSGSRNTATVEYQISRQEFAESGGSLYLPNLDLLVSSLSYKYVPHHPFSKAGVRQTMIDNDPLLNSNEGLSFNVRIVDKLARFGDRFVNIDGKVYRIRAIRESQVADGVYVVSHVPASGNHDYLIPKAEYYTFEEADKALSLYLTYNEAKTLGNPQDVYKRELDERNHQLKIQQQDWEREKFDRERELAEARRLFEEERDRIKREQMAREEEIRQRQHVLDVLERDAAITKAQYERDTLFVKETLEARSARRKETIEVLKYVPAVIAAVGAIYAAYKKLKS